MGDSTYIRRIRCSRFYRYTIELIDRFFLDASLMTAILPVERLVSNRLYIETWVIPRHWNKWRLQHWFNTGRVIIRAQAKEEARSKSISGNYPRARIWIRCYFPSMKYDHRRYFTLDACAFNNRPDERVARHGYNDNRGIRILLPLLASFSV